MRLELVRAAAGKGPAKAPKPAAMQKKPAKTELDGNKWNIVRRRSLISARAARMRSSLTDSVLLSPFPFSPLGPQENHENERGIVIEQTEINQTVNVFNVKGSIIQVKGKVNAISLGASPASSVSTRSSLLSGAALTRAPCGWLTQSTAPRRRSWSTRPSRP